MRGVAAGGVAAVTVGMALACRCEPGGMGGEVDGASASASTRLRLAAAQPAHSLALRFRLDPVIEEPLAEQDLDLVLEVGADFAYAFASGDTMATDSGGESGGDSAKETGGGSGDSGRVTAVRIRWEAGGALPEPDAVEVEVEAPSSGHALAELEIPCPVATVDGTMIPCGGAWTLHLEWLSGPPVDLLLDATGQAEARPWEPDLAPESSLRLELEGL